MRALLIFFLPLWHCAEHEQTAGSSSLVLAASPGTQAYKFGDFYSPIMNDGDFDAKPMVLLIGQYSVGKTSFIRYLLGRDFPGQHIGPEPTTDRFIAVMHGMEDKTTPGNACLLYTSPSPRDRTRSRMPSSA